MTENQIEPLNDSPRSVPIDYATDCCVLFCWRRATRAALDDAGEPMPVCDEHEPFAHLMTRGRNL